MYVCMLAWALLTFFFSSLFFFILLFFSFHCLRANREYCKGIHATTDVPRGRHLFLSETIPLDLYLPFKRLASYKRFVFPT